MRGFTARHGADDEQRLNALGDRVGQRFIESVVREIALAATPDAALRAHR
jgi:hypothetical protein